MKKIATAIGMTLTAASLIFAAPAAAHTGGHGGGHAGGGHAGVGHTAAAFAGPAARSGIEGSHDPQVGMVMSTGFADGAGATADHACSSSPLTAHGPC